MQLVIIAGGKATRLGLTDIPKPMCPILDKPILELLNITVETPFEITTDGKNLILSPQLEMYTDTEIMRTLEKKNKKQ